MEWSPVQVTALDKVGNWLKKKNTPVFRLFGFAGTGKTTLARHLAASIPGKVEFAAYTGKAASVMQRNGCHGARTLHSLIYTTSNKSDLTVKELRQKLSDLIQELCSEYKEKNEHVMNLIETNNLVRELREEIRREEQGLKQPMFRLNVDSDLRRASLLVIDECSMVEGKMGEDILSFNVPVLVLGDPAQLPPVKGSGFFTADEPDVLLTEIHRQARDNPIIRMAEQVRKGGSLMPGEYGSSRVITLAQATAELFTSHDQMICGREKRPRGGGIYRQALNNRMRQILGHNVEIPTTNEKVICLRNNREAGLLNGGMFIVQKSFDTGDGFISMTMCREEEKEKLQAVVCHKRIFLGQELEYADFSARDIEHFDFGYAITCHKSQGSQWPSVLVFDQSRIFSSSRMNWLYTAITRAQERVTVISDIP